MISSVYAGLLFFVFVFDLVFIEKLRQSQVVGVDRVAGGKQEKQKPVFDADRDADIRRQGLKT